MIVLGSVAGTSEAVGTCLGTSSWLRIDQDRINLFADATGDHQWIHTDVPRAAEGPFGSTIAHGFLTLALVAGFSAEIYRIENASLVVNYGCDSVRFTAPVRVGSAVRGRADLISCDPDEHGAKLRVKFTVEIQGETRPALVAETLLLVHFEKSRAA